MCRGTYKRKAYSDTYAAEITKPKRTQTTQEPPYDHAKIPPSAPLLRTWKTTTNTSLSNLGTHDQEVPPLEPTTPT